MPATEVPHVLQLYHALESHLSELAIKPRLAVVFGTGDTEIRLGEQQQVLELELRTI